VQSKQYLEILSAVGEAYNSPIGTTELLERTARAIVEQLGLKGCQFRLLSQDQELLEHIASYGLSPTFLAVGPVEAGRAMAEALGGEPVVIADCAADPRVQHPEAHVTEGLKAAITVPLRTRGQVIGVMQCYAGRSREYSDTDLKLMEVVAAFCARAVTNSMFHQILDNVTAAIRSSLSLNAALESVARAISEDLRAKGCTIHLLDAEDKELKLRASFGLSTRFLAFQKREPGQGIAEALQGRCTQLVDPRAEPASPYLAKVIEEGISSVLHVPLMIRAKAVGVLCLYTHNPYPFSDDEKYFMKAIADECGLAIQQSRMYAMLRQSYQTLVDDFQIWFESGYRQL
jgi:GAF domain-containing protein